MNQRPEEIQSQYYTQTAAQYDAMHVAEGDEHAAALQFISGFISQLGIASVLDVGCGTGRGLRHFMQKHPGMRIKGVEPVAALLEQAVQQHAIPPEIVVNARGEALPF